MSLKIKYNIYCDESCHLENDHQKAMVLGAVWCPVEETRIISKYIREIKKKYGLSPKFEIKWVKVSPSKLDFYLELMDYFFNNENLHFRAIIIPDKSKLNHKAFKQDHDTWYYKMYFEMLKIIISPYGKYRVYLDYKDTQGGSKVIKLHNVLCYNMYDFSREIIERIQLVNSKEVEILQITDLLIGVIAYVNRGMSSSPAKSELVNHMRKRSGYTLIKTTLYRENKVNLLIWTPTISE